LTASFSTHAFMSHPLTPPERLWLAEFARSPGITPKTVKVKLFDQLPSDFSPDHLDPRLYVAGRLTRLAFGSSIQIIGYLYR
jgi:hypothetical protein